jgi:hypothetical protein
MFQVSFRFFRITGLILIINPVFFRPFCSEKYSRSFGYLRNIYNSIMMLLQKLHGSLMADNGYKYNKNIILKRNVAKKCIVKSKMEVRERMEEKMQ